MHLYRQSIVIFGIVLPAFICLVLCGSGYMVMSNMDASFKTKLKDFKTNEQARLAALAIETEVTREHEHTKRWKDQLAMETASALQSNARTIIEKLPAKEIQQTAFERPSTRGGFGAANSQNSSQVRISFRGTFRTLQRAFLELETTMPQLQLQELRMDPASNQASLLNFQVTYTAWENDPEPRASDAKPAGTPRRLK